MIIFGILLLVVAVVFGLDVVWKDTFSIGHVSAFGQSLGLHNANSLFVLGAIVGAAIALALFLLMAGTRAKARGAVAERRKRRSFRETMAERERLHEENAHLRAQLEQVSLERDAAAHVPSGVPAQGPADPMWNDGIAPRRTMAEGRTAGGEPMVAPGAPSATYEGQPVVELRDTQPAPAPAEPVATGHRSGWLHRSRS